MANLQLSTAFLLMAQFEGRILIPLEEVRAAYFYHLSMPRFSQKLAAGDIELPVMHLDGTLQSARGVHTTVGRKWRASATARGLPGRVE